MTSIDEYVKRHTAQDGLEQYMAESRYDRQLIIGMTCNSLTYLEAQKGLRPGRVQERLAGETRGSWMSPLEDIQDVFQELAHIGIVERDASGKITPHPWAVRYLTMRDYHNPWITRVA